ncbi:MAG: hypothetical protein E7048_00975 [Lentisphaerae bacterium]|nr:hypothetical protein [Lentisphaerota bacterium]
MKNKKLFLLLGCCCILSGCAADLTFKEKCTAVYKWFTALHKDNEYIFTLRNVKDKKALREIIFDFCSTNDFEFIIEKEEHFSEDYEKRLDEAFLLTQPKIKVFIFHHKTLDAALFYIPEKNQIEISENAYESHMNEKKNFSILLKDFCEFISKNKIDYRLEKLEWSRGLEQQSNVKTTVFWYSNPESAKKHATKYTLLKP